MATREGSWRQGLTDIDDGESHRGLAFRLGLRFFIRAYRNRCLARLFCLNAQSLRYLSRIFTLCRSRHSRLAATFL